MTDYLQLLFWLLMKLKLYNFVEQHLVPYEYTSISLVVIEASMWLLWKEVLLYDSDWQVMLSATSSWHISKWL